MFLRFLKKDKNPGGTALIQPDKGSARVRNIPHWVLPWYGALCGALAQDAIRCTGHHMPLLF